jgi:hypothetical protein
MKITAAAHPARPLKRELNARGLSANQVAPVRRRACARVHAMAVGLGAAGLLVAALIEGSAGWAAEPVPVAITEFDYVDTSGEVQDQTAKHKALIAAFTDALRTDLGQSTKFRVVSLLCDGQPCSVRGTDPSDLLPRARSAGAKLLLFGGIHKESTLVQWAKVDVVDVERHSVVYDRLLTFRGDDAYAWRRAEEFLAQDLESADLSK